MTQRGKSLPASGKARATRKAKRSRPVPRLDLPLGWPRGSVAQPVGFIRQATAPPTPHRREPIAYAGEGHLLTVAPTGAGKGVSAVIPALLAHDGPIVCVDPKGENYAVTAERRRQLGQQVIKIDPFGVIDGSTDQLNPFDLLALHGAVLEDDSRSLCDLLTGGVISLRDPFWDTVAGQFLSGLILYIASEEPPERRNLASLRDLFKDDLDYELAVLLDTKGQRMNDDAYGAIAAYLAHPERETRPSVRSTAQQHLRFFGSPGVRRATERSSFDLQAFVNGAPMSIYVIMPPSKLSSHRGLLRLWLGTLMLALTHRDIMPAQRTLLLIDEAAQLGRLEPLLQAITLLRGYGVQSWTFWQDVSQLQALYPQEWPTIVNNCAVVQLFGARNRRMAEDYAALLGGVTPETVLDLAEDEQMLLIDGNGPTTTRRVDYRKDTIFRGLWTPNPRFAPRPRERQR